MPTKIYQCNVKNFTTFLLVNGKTRCVRFLSVSDNSSCSEYITNNAAEQSALEASNKFGVRYKLVRTIDDTVVPASATPNGDDVEPAQTPAKEYPNVKNIQEAVEVLHEEYGVAEESINKKIDVLREAAKLNIAFPNLKK